MNEKNIDEIINKELNFKKEDKQSNNEYKNLEKKIVKMNEKIEYIDANIKANYLTIIFSLLYYIISNQLNFQRYLNIPNIFSLIIFILLLSMFFYKENMILSKMIIKKLFMKNNL